MLSVPPLDIHRLTSAGLVDRIEYQHTLDSTNDRARALAAELSPADTLLVVAEQQTAGRGRGTNRWWTGSGSLAFSLLLDPAHRGIERRYHAMLPLAAAVSIIESIAPQLPHRHVGLHWPNDVFVDDRKLAGILVEVLPDGRHIVGAGCNVNNTVAAAPDELRTIATTLLDETGREQDRTGLLLDVLTQFWPTLAQLAIDPAELGHRADELCLQRGRSLTVESAGRRTTGVCRGIAEDGALLLETVSGVERVYAGVVIKR